MEKISREELKKNKKSSYDFRGNSRPKCTLLCSKIEKKNINLRSN